jgi:hypothetical protein
MPLDKMPDSGEFAITHNSKVLHTQGHPVACIIDENGQDSQYHLLSNNPSLKAGLTGFLNKHDDLGLLIGFKLQIQTDSEFFEYTVYPNEEFVDTVILNESISIINEKMETLFTLRKIVTDQFVKTRSEFDKFQKMLS